jgi:hypothetical protein
MWRANYVMFLLCVHMFLLPCKIEQAGVRRSTIWVWTQVRVQEDRLELVVLETACARALG